MILRVRNLVKRYPSRPHECAVGGISFSLQEGEILGLLGPNGSGKTTTIQMLLGTLSSTSGDIEYFGLPFPKKRREILQKVSFASTYTSLPYPLTIEENLEVVGRLYGMSREKILSKSRPLLERFGLRGMEKTKVANLSAGQTTRLVLVKAFFLEPKIVLLDEPTASLDPEMSRDICEFIVEEQQKRGVSILFTSHKMEEVAEVCDRVIFLHKGKVLADDVPQKLARSASRYRLRLTIPDGMKRAVVLAEGMGGSCTLDHRLLEISLEEEQIPRFLHALSQANIVYSTIQIQEPSLSEYFLQIAKL